MKYSTMLLALASLMATSAQAQHTSMVSAGDPEGLVKALDDAGYDPVLGTDQGGDPKITMAFGGREGVILFYGCDENAKDNCDAIQFNVGFDRAKPWTAEEAIKLSTQFRFAATSLDDDGDPFIRWDVITGDGIPRKVFLRSVLAFTNLVADAEQVVFADE